MNKIANRQVICEDRVEEAAEDDALSAGAMSAVFSCVPPPPAAPPAIATTTTAITIQNHTRLYTGFFASILCPFIRTTCLLTRVNPRENSATKH